jgi:hypothetical protein
MIEVNFRNSTFALVVALLLLGCEDPYLRARDGFLQADKIESALAQYRRDNGRFPATLDELHPRYLHQRPSRIEDYRAEFRFFYSRGEVRYQLGFFYGGNHSCVNEPGPRGPWTCSTAY